MGNQHGTRDGPHTGDKRKSDGGLVNSEPAEKKKISLSMNSSLGGSSGKKISVSLGNPGKPPTAGQNSVAKTPVNPVKLSMSSKQVSCVFCKGKYFFGREHSSLLHVYIQ